MRYLKVFVASSIVEFKRERIRIEAAFNPLNARLISEHGAFAEVVLCEDLDNSIRVGGTQASVIDPQIRESDLFVLLVGKTVGSYTLGEIDLALEGTSRLLAFFKKVAPDETVANLRSKLERATSCRCETLVDIDAAMASIERELELILGSCK